MCSFLSAKSSENARKIRKKIEVSQNFRAEFFFRAENPLDRAMARASSVGLITTSYIQTFFIKKIRVKSYVQKFYMEFDNMLFLFPLK